MRGISHCHCLGFSAAAPLLWASAKQEGGYIVVSLNLSSSRSSI